MRIELCGGIGAGKTTFANLMRRIGIEPVIENFSANPFWEAFYSNPGQHIFETELTFMLQHYHQIKIFGEKQQPYICDFSPTQDLAYARIGLQGSKLSIFASLHEEIISEVGSPNLLVYLSCNVEVMRDRIERRGRDVEKNIPAEFLNALTSAVEEELKNIKQYATVITIDSVKENFASDESGKAKVLDLIKHHVAT